MAPLKGLLKTFFPSQMNSSYAMLGIKLYLANVQGKILNDLSVFHTSDRVTHSPLRSEGL